MRNEIGRPEINAMRTRTDGELLKGVRFEAHVVHTQSLVMRSASGTVRLINAIHRVDTMKA